MFIRFTEFVQLVYVVCIYVVHVLRSTLQIDQLIKKTNDSLCENVCQPGTIGHTLTQTYIDNFLLISFIGSQVFILKGKF